MAIEVKTFPYGPLGENTYLVTDVETGEQAIIDPGYYGNRVTSKINNDCLKYVILTHGHFDHFNSAEEYLSTYKSAKFIAPEKDKYLMSKGTDTEFAKSGMEHNACPVADMYVTENDVIELGATKFTFIETPGHTEGGMCVLADDILFSGDTLFRLSVGNTSFETGNFQVLVQSIQNKLFVLDDDIKVYPGHGFPTTIGYEKRANPFV